jgi:hypothetical protein
MLATYFYLKFLKKQKKNTSPNWFLNMKHILQIGQISIIDKTQLGRNKWKLKRP